MIVWGKHIAGYLRLRRQLGFSLAWQEHLLIQFTDHLEAAGAEVITIADAIAWAGLLPEGVTDPPATRASTRLTAIRGFATYLHTLDPAHEVPPRDVFSRHVPRPTPHIYTHVEIAALISAAGKLNGGVRAETYPVLFGLLAATGLRIGEVLAMDREDTDLEAGVLTITRGSKSRDPRLVPVHPTTTAALRRYSAWRDEHIPQPDNGTAAFFIDKDGDRLDYTNVRNAFVQASAASGLRTADQQPRMHDLRHTFAVNTLLGWYRSGVDVATKMPTLSTYLGHTDPANTYWYISAVPELLAHAAARLAAANDREQVGS